MKFITLLLCLVAFAPTVTIRAQATPAPSARTLFRQGEAEYAAGRYQEAISLWERAYAMDPRAGLQYNLAQAYGRSGLLTEERRALELFLSRLAETEPEAAESADAISARARITAIDERIARTAIVLRGVPRHADITLDGAPVTLEVDRVRVEPGSHTIRVVLEGFEAFTSTVTVVAATTAEVHVELVPVRADAAIAPAPVVLAAPPESASRVPVALLVTGATVFAGGSVLGGLAIHYSRGTLRGTDRAQRGRAFGIAADVTLGVGIAAAGTGALMLLLRDDPREADAPSVTPAVASSALGTTMPAIEVSF